MLWLSDCNLHGVATCDLAKICSHFKHVFTSSLSQQLHECTVVHDKAPVRVSVLTRDWAGVCVCVCVRVFLEVSHVCHKSQ